MRSTCLYRGRSLPFSLLGLNGPAHAVERADVPEKYRWDLSALYPDEAAWAAAKQDFLKAIPGVGDVAGQARRRPPRACSPP